nr:MAG TPA: ParB protein [Caudoviricetes sp.]
MEIQYINIDEIVEYKNNVKIHTQEQIEQIMTSIERYGNNDPIAIDENNVIIEGHGRYLALKELGEIEIPVIQLKHLTEEQKREYILVHNKLTMNTGFDIEKLKAELETIDFDMTLFNFQELNFNEDVLSELFEDIEDKKSNKEKEVIVCPHCGEVID